MMRQQLPITAMKLLFASRMFLKRHARPLAVVLLALTTVAGSSCSMFGGTDEKAKTVSHREKFHDDEQDILQSHTDARQGLNLPHDQPGLANDGTGWSGYR